jgi:putative methyltransferase (TIGR04325 family)
LRGRRDPALSSVATNRVLYPAAGRLAGQQRLLREAEIVGPPRAFEVESIHHRCPSVGGRPISSFEYVGTEWPQDDSGPADWGDFAALLISALPQFMQVLKGTDPLGILPLAPHARSESNHNVSMTFAYVLARAAQGKAQLSMLDWGGALGHYALMAGRLIPEVALQVTVKERQELCQIGRQLLPWVTFEPTDEACFARAYDLVMASASLQYALDWQLVLSGLAGAAQPWLFVSRLPTVRATPCFVVRPRPVASGPRLDHPFWVINRDVLVEHVESLGLTLQREFITGQSAIFAGAPEQSEGVGFLFKR